MRVEALLGILPVELLEVSQQLRVAELGITNAELLYAHASYLRTKDELSDYVFRRAAGVSHKEALAFLGPRAPEGYVSALDLGASHVQCMQVLTLETDLYYYSWALNMSLPHEIYMHFLRLGYDMPDVITLLQNKVPISELAGLPGEVSRTGMLDYRDRFIARRARERLGY